MKNQKLLFIFSDIVDIDISYEQGTYIITKEKKILLDE